MNLSLFLSVGFSNTQMPAQVIILTDANELKLRSRSSWGEKRGAESRNHCQMQSKKSFLQKKWKTLKGILMR